MKTISMPRSFKLWSMIRYYINEISIDGVQQKPTDHETYLQICSLRGLFHVAAFGTGTKYQKMEANRIWNGILFIRLEEDINLPPEKKIELKNYFGIQ